MSIGPKQALYAEFAAVARALGSPHRLEILDHLAQGERSVEALAERLGLPVANTSHHLRHLRRARLVASRRDGKFVVYRLSGDAVLAATGGIARFAERHHASIDEIRRTFFETRDRFEPVSRAALLERMGDGRVTVLDVRPADEFAAGHLPGSANIPVAELETRLDELDPGQEIVAYCRGRWCILAFEAVSTLRARGFEARRLEDGFPEWQAAGLPVDRARHGAAAPVS